MNVFDFDLILCRYLFVFVYGSKEIEINDLTKCLSHKNQNCISQQKKNTIHKKNRTLALKGRSGCITDYIPMCHLRILYLPILAHSKIKLTNNYYE